MIDSIHNRPSPKLNSPAQPTLASPGRGFRADFSDTVDAQRPAIIQSRGFVVEAGALGDVGEGLQKVGGALGDIAEARFQAINTRKIAEAELILREADHKIAQEVAGQQQNPEKWVPLTAKRTAELRKVVLTPDLSPAARRTIELRHLKWSIETEGQMAISAARQEFNLTGQTLNAAYMKAYKDGNYAQAGSYLDQLQAGGYEAADAVEGKRGQITNALRGEDDLRAQTVLTKKGAAGVEEASAIYQNSPLWTPAEREAKVARLTYAGKKESMAMLAYDDPFKARLEARQTLHGPDAIAIERQAESRIQEVRALNLGDYQNRVQTGDPPSEEELGLNPYLLPGDIKMVRDYAERGPRNDGVSYATLYADAANFEGSRESPEYQAIVQQSKLALDEKQGSQVLRRLDQSANQKNRDSVSRALGDVSALARDDLKAGKFGSLHGPLADLKTQLPAKMRAEVDLLKQALLTPEEKQRIEKEPSRADYIEAKARDHWYQQQPNKTDGNSFQTYVVEDEARAGTATRRYHDVMEDLDDWVKKNPAATGREVRAKYSDLLATHRAADQVRQRALTASRAPRASSLNQKADQIIQNVSPSPTPGK